MKEILQGELLKIQKRLRTQLDYLAECKAVLDAAIATGSVSMMTSIDERCKRQAKSVAATKEALKECEDALAKIEDQQLDLVKAAEKAAAEESSPPPKGNAQAPRGGAKAQATT